MTNYDRRISCRQASAERNARRHDSTRVTVGASIHDILIWQGYKLVQDAWNTDGR